MSGPKNILSDSDYESIKPVLAQRITQVAESITATNFNKFIDTLSCDILQEGFNGANAHEGTVWLLDEARENLVPAYNTGPNAKQIVGKFRQPLNAGLIGMVFANEQPFLENEVYNNSRQSRLLDDTLKTRTYALIEAPFYFIGACRGVVSCVRLKDPLKDSKEPDPPRFENEDLDHIMHAADIFSRLVELKIIHATLDW